MPSYRLEALLYHPEKNLEDTLEKEILTKLYDMNGLAVQIVAFQVYPNGSGTLV